MSTLETDVSLDYREVVREIESKGVIPERPPSLEVMKNALKQVLPSEIIAPRRVIVVAGTNGKGSVCATLEALLLAAGKKVGLYTSPHLEETTERIRVNGNDISQELFCKAYEIVKTKTQGAHLSHFEALTLMASWIFFSSPSESIEQESPLDWIILEVGLGGTWDATNAIPHHWSVITSLGLDHQNLLGNTLTEIALNKFGIIHPGNQVIHSPLPAEVIPTARQIQLSTQSHWNESIPFELKVETHSREPQFILQTPWGEAPLALPGRRAGENTATALTVFHSLGYSPQDYLKTLKQVCWPGRMERVESPKFQCPVYFSGDHNPQGVQSLIEILKHYPRKRLLILVGVGKDKDLQGILSPLASLPQTELFLTETPFKGRPIDSYGHWLERSQGAWPNPITALTQILSKAQPEDLILVTGSLYLVGFLKRELRAIGWI